ncbi:MAG: (d)CMP kinase [Clostridiales Family XIII bacterium]|jgi:cytidylate kinase|nr:(d)CMP kinase [Clostridiales Family XIII bacterium]
MPEGFSRPGVFQVAVDGPSGAGKSTVARALASRLSIEYIDTGAMYRAVAFKLMESGLDAADGPLVGRMLDGTSMDFAEGRVILDGRDVSGLIRTAEVSGMASLCSALPQVRERLVPLQRAMGSRKSVVMDGRDIGSNVFPDARFKFFLTASAEERARRRQAELAGRGENLSFEAVLADIGSRDYNDSHRALNPLVRAADAAEIDSTAMTAREVVDLMLGMVRAGLCDPR